MHAIAIRFNGKDFRISRQDCCIIRATLLIEALDASEDFRVKVIYASPVFIEKSTPNTNYGMRTLILDFFDFHIRINAPREKHSSSGVHIMGKFISMLERGDYRRIRTVRHYASELCVTPKHLSEIAERFNFTSLSYFTRYVSRHIGQSPSDYRK